MSSKVETIAWQKLQHAYGYANDVPEMLSALVSADVAVREEALEYFWGNLYQDGDRFEATCCAIPFLYDVLSTAAPEFRHHIIDLLLRLGVGKARGFLPAGYGIKLADEEREFEAKEYGGDFRSSDNRSAYFAAGKYADAMLSYLSTDHPAETRLAASYYLSHFAGFVEPHRESVFELLQNESDDAVRQGLLLCYGMLCRHGGTAENAARLDSYLEETQTPELQFTAAIAIVTALGEAAPQTAVDTLLTALSEARGLPSARGASDCWWNAGDLLGYAAVSLDLVGKDYDNRKVEALLNTIGRGKLPTTQIPSILIRLVFPEPRPQGGWDPESLNDAQRHAICMILLTDNCERSLLERLFFTNRRGRERYSAFRHFFQSMFGEATADTLFDKYFTRRPVE